MLGGESLRSRTMCGDTRRARGVMGLLFFCALLGLCSARVGLSQNGEHPDWHGHDHSTARDRTPASHGHGGRRVCAPKPDKQDCGPGFYRMRRGLHQHDCVPCQCNALSECEDGTGRCLDCQYNTAGDRCERCKEGYYGNATQRTCHVCPCPFTVLSNSFASSCMELDDGFMCVCKPGYTGLRCERCAPRYYGNPMEFMGSCEPCNCDNGNTNICDSKTGECDNCVQALLNDLEGMDEELAWLKTQLENSITSSIAQEGLKKLEEAIAATQNLVSKYSSSVNNQRPKVKELEADVNTLHTDISQLRKKANKTLFNAQRMVEKTDETHQRAEHVVSKIQLLLLGIQDLLEQLEDTSGSRVNTEKLSRMLMEAKKMVREMQIHDCSAQWEAAEREWEESLKLLLYIKNNVVEPRASNDGEAMRISSMLKWHESQLKHLKAALKEAAGTAGRATRQNALNAPALEDVQQRSKDLGEEHDVVSKRITRARDQLKDTAGLLEVLGALTMRYERLAAQLDGARTHLINKVNVISQAASKEPMVVRAEKHAGELNLLARKLQDLVKNATNGSDVRHAINVTGAYNNIPEAVSAAGAAARQAKEAAEKALNNVKREDLPKRAKNLKDQANNLLTKAQDAQNDQKRTAGQQATQGKRLDQAWSKTETLQKDLRMAQGELAKSKRDGIGAILDVAKANVASAKDTINNVMNRLDSIRDRLGEMNVTAPDLNFDGFLDDVDKTVSNLTAFILPLLERLNRTEESSLLPQSSNISESIRRIKEVILQARDAANRIPVPVDFSGDGHVELRPPTDLEDLKAYTNLALSLQRPITPNRVRTRRQKPSGTGNMFVLYLGNKNSSKDYIGMALRDNVLYCVYKLGGAEHQIKTSAITESSSEGAFFDRVNFRRIYQDAEVIFTKLFTSSKPHTPQSSTSQGDSTRTLLHLNPADVVFYVGGYPQKNFTPPAALHYPGYKGCIEFSSFNDQFISLYNFKNAININRKRPCKRYYQDDVSRYFEGTGYARGAINKQQDIYRFFQYILSHSENAMLFYIGNEKSYYSLVVEKGYIVLRGREGDNIFEQKSAKKEFPLTESKEIQVILLGQQKKILVRVTGQEVITAMYTQGVFNSYYIGGLAPSLRERDNITTPPFKGCITNIKLDSNVIKFEDELGVGRGCPSQLLEIRESMFSLGGSLSSPPRGFELTGDVTISLGFRSTQNEGVLLRNSQGDTGMELSLVQGFVVFKLNHSARKSNKMYKDGKWHYLTAEKRGSRLEMRVDEEDVGVAQSPSSLVPAPGQDILLGKAFQGCLTNLYMRRPKALCQPEDLSAFSSSGDAFLGFCVAESPPQSLLVKHDHGRSVRKRDRVSGCSLPSPVKRAHHLRGPTSHLSYNITSQVLNHRPHFALAFRTRSADGLLLFVCSKPGHSHVVLYMTQGRIKLAVGGNQPIVHKEKCNDNKWHKVMFSLEMNTFHLIVDDVRAVDGVLLHTNGSSLDLKPPVYLGSVPQSNYTESQTSFPKDSLVGCVRNFKMNSQRIEEPSAIHGAPPCFDGNTEGGTYFSGNGGYVVLDYTNSLFLGAGFHLEFEIRPRNLTGILLHIGEHHHPHLTLFMQKGQVVLQVSGAAGESSVSVAQRGLCDGLFHHVTVARKNNHVQLSVDKRSGSTRVPNASFFGITGGHHLYMGSVPETLQHDKLHIKTSFIGCIRNLRINRKPLSFGEASQVFGPVNLQECPVS